MDKKTFKLSLCCLFGTMCALHDARSSQTDTSQSLDNDASLANAKAQQVKMDPATKLSFKYGSSHVSNSHPTQQELDQLKAAGVSSDVIKLITDTREGYLYEHLKVTNNINSLTEVASLSEHNLNNYNGGPLTIKEDLRDSVRNAYKSVVDQVNQSKTSKDFKMLIQCTGGTTNGKDLASDGSNSHKAALEKALESVSVTIEGKIYTGVRGLELIEQQLQQKTSFTNQSHLEKVEDALSQALADKAEEYRNKNNSQGSFFGSAADDVYFNYNEFKQYQEELSNNSLTKTVQKMIENNKEELQKYGALTDKQMRETILHNASTAKEEHDIHNTIELTNAYEEAMKHLSSVDIENHVNNYTAHTQLGGEAKDELRNALKTFYENIPLTHEGIETALKVTGGSRDGTPETSHQTELRNKLENHLDQLKRISQNLAATTNQDTIDGLRTKQETLATEAKKILTDYAEEHATKSTFNKAANDAYLDVSAMKQYMENREELFPEHFGTKLAESYALHETTTSAHTAAISNAKKSSTNDN